jgi:hypothetical protein
MAAKVSHQFRNSTCIKGRHRIRGETVKSSETIPAFCQAR